MAEKRRSARLCAKSTDQLIDSNDKAEIQKLKPRKSRTCFEANKEQPTKDQSSRKRTPSCADITVKIVPEILPNAAPKRIVNAPVHKTVGFSGYVSSSSGSIQPLSQSAKTSCGLIGKKVNIIRPKPLETPKNQFVLQTSIRPVFCNIPKIQQSSFAPSVFSTPFATVNRYPVNVNRVEFEALKRENEQLKQKEKQYKMMVQENETLKFKVTQLNAIKTLQLLEIQSKTMQISQLASDHGKLKTRLN